MLYEVENEPVNARKCPVKFQDNLVKFQEYFCPFFLPGIFQEYFCPCIEYAIHVKHC
jgi:hypothetical protein